MHRIDGDGDLPGQVHAAFKIVLVEGGGNGAGLRQDLLGKRIRQAKSADDRQSIDPRLAARAENFDDDPFPSVLRRWKTEHFNDDLVLRLCPLGPRIADVNAVAEYRAIDAHVTLSFALEIGADELVGGAFEDLHDLAGRAQVRPARLLFDPDQDLIAGGGIADGVLRDVDFLADGAIDRMGPDEAEAAFVFAKDAAGRAMRRHRPHRLVLADLEAALLDKSFEEPAKIRIVSGRHAQLAGQALGFERLIIFPGQGGQDLLREFFHSAILRSPDKGWRASRDKRFRRDARHSHYFLMVRSSVSPFLKVCFFE